MKADAELALDQIRHPRTGPEWGFVAQPFRPRQQKLHQTAALLWPQLRPASRPPRLFQPGLTLRPPLVHPALHRAIGHLQPTRHLRLFDPLLQQPDGFKPPPLQRRKIPSHSLGVSHLHRDAHSCSRES